MARGTAQFICLLLAASLLYCCTVRGSDSLVVSMCTELDGFAGGYNDHISIPVSMTPLKGEAIILVVRAFPTNLGDLSQRWIQLNATYRLVEGETVSSLSNNDGIVIVSDVEGGTNINIEVKRIRKDAPVPFRFWSYHANRPVCYIDISPSGNFVAPVPTTISEVATPAGIYFKSIAPQGAKGLMVNVPNHEQATAMSFRVSSSPNDPNGVTHQSNEVFPWMNAVAYLMFTPAVSTSGYVLLEVSVVWTDDVTDAGKPPGQQPAGDHPSEAATSGARVGASSSAATEVGGNASGKNLVSDDNKGWSTVGFVLILLFCFFVYLVILSVVNYRIKGVTQFPEMVPHIDVFRSCSKWVLLVKDSLGKGEFRTGYHELNREEMNTDSFR